MKTYCGRCREFAEWRTYCRGEASSLRRFLLTLHREHRQTHRSVEMTVGVC